MNHRYLIGLGSNMRHRRIGSPREVLGAGAGAMIDARLDVLAISKAVSSRPIGPSQRAYANAAVLIESELDPPALLEVLQSIEHAFGRRRQGQRWRARVLDLDILMWSGGIWHSPSLQIPHPQMRFRDFVIGPAAQIAGDWRDPLSGFTIDQINARLKKTKEKGPTSRPSPLLA